MSCLLEVGGWIKCSRYHSERNHRRMKKAELLSPLDKHDVGKRQRRRIAGDMAKEGGSGRTDMAEDIEKEDTIVFYYVLTPHLLQVTKEECLAKFGHSIPCHSLRCLGPFSGMLSLPF